MVRYARHCVCYVESFQMSGIIMGLACVRNVRVVMPTFLQVAHFQGTGGILDNTTGQLP